MTEKLVDARAIAELLGVPESWVREHTRSGDVPHVPLGRYVRYRVSEVIAWVETRQGPVNQPGTMAGVKALALLEQPRA